MVPELYVPQSAQGVVFIEGRWLRPRTERSVAETAEECARALSRKVDRAVVVFVRGSLDAFVLTAVGRFSESDVLRCVDRRARQSGREVMAASRETWRGRALVRVGAQETLGRTGQTEVVFLPPSMVLVGARGDIDATLDAALASVGRVELPRAVRAQWPLLPSRSRVRGVVKLSPSGGLPGVTAVRVWAGAEDSVTLNAGLVCENQQSARALSLAIDAANPGGVRTVQALDGVEFSQRVDGSVIFLSAAVRASVGPEGGARGQGRHRAPWRP